MSSRWNLPTLPMRSAEPESSEYCATVSSNVAPDRIFASASPARAFASVLLRVTPLGARLAVRYATRMCWAMIVSGTGATDAEATASGAAEGATDGEGAEEAAVGVEDVACELVDG